LLAYSNSCTVICSCVHITLAFLGLPCRAHLWERKEAGMIYLSSSGMCVIGLRSSEMSRQRL